MKTITLIICISISLNLYSQSLTLNDLERFDTLSSSSARISFLTNKGFSFLENKNDTTNTGTVIHRTVYVKGIFTSHDSTYNKEAILWISEMTTKEFAYKTPDGSIYNDMIRQIRQRYPRGSETTDANGNVSIKYTRKKGNISGSLNKNTNQDGTSTIFCNLQFSPN